MMTNKVQNLKFKQERFPPVLRAVWYKYGRYLFLIFVCKLPSQKRVGFVLPFVGMDRSSPISFLSLIIA